LYVIYKTSVEVWHRQIFYYTEQTLVSLATHIKGTTDAYKYPGIQTQIPSELGIAKLPHHYWVQMTGVAYN